MACQLNHLTAKCVRELPTSGAIHKSIKIVPSLAGKENGSCEGTIYATMEAFHLLSRGGVNFDKQRFKGDVKLFRVRLARFTLVDFFPSKFSRELLIMMPGVGKKRHPRMASCPPSLIFSNMQ